MLEDACMEKHTLNGVVNGGLYQLKVRILDEHSCIKCTMIICILLYTIVRRTKLKEQFCVQSYIQSQYKTWNLLKVTQLRHTTVLRIEIPNSFFCIHACVPFGISVLFSESDGVLLTIIFLVCPKNSRSKAQWLLITDF